MNEYSYYDNGRRLPCTKIAIGCGKRYYGPDWIHNDIVPHPAIDCISYAHSLSIESDSMDLIYASHVLPYYDWEAAKSIVLPEWKRILKPGGTLRVAVPDFGKICKLLYDDSWFGDCIIGLSDVIGPLFGKMGGEEGNIYHKSAYDAITLFGMLGRVGFSKISYWDWQTVEHAGVDDHSQAYLPKIPLTDPDKKKKDMENGILISLNIECVKP